MKKNNVLFLMLGTLLSCNTMMAMIFNNQSIETNNGTQCSSSSSRSNNNDSNQKENAKTSKKRKRVTTKTTAKKKKDIHTHTGKKSFKCTWCEKELATKQSLERHIRTHTGEKPYKCTRCEKEFADSGNCKKHQDRCKKSLDNINKKKNKKKKKKKETPQINNLSFYKNSSNENTDYLVGCLNFATKKATLTSNKNDSQSPASTNNYPVEQEQQQNTLSIEEQALFYSYFTMQNEPQQLLTQIEEQQTEYNVEDFFAKQ